MCSETIDLTTVVGAPCSARAVAFLPAHPRVKGNGHDAAATGDGGDGGSKTTATTLFGGGGGDGVAMALVTSTDRLAIMLAGREGPTGVPLPPALLAVCNLRDALGDFCGVGPDTPFFIRQFCWTECRASSSSSSPLATHGEGGDGLLTSTFLCVAWVGGADMLIEFDVQHGSVIDRAGGEAAVKGAPSPAVVVPVGHTKLAGTAVRLQVNECGALNDRLVAVLALGSGVVLRCVRGTSQHRSGSSAAASRTHVLLVPWLDSPEWTTSVAQTTGLAVLAVKASSSSSSGDDERINDLADISDDDSDANDPHGSGGGGVGDGGGALSDVDVSGSGAAIELAIVTLSSAGQLCVNGRLISSNCNSFVVHDSFLLFATHDHALRFLDTQIPLNDALDALDSGSRGVLAAAAERSVERGSRIVTVVPFGTRVVLQVNRFPPFFFFFCFCFAPFFFSFLLLCENPASARVALHSPCTCLCINLCRFFS
jgi:hypothetical protein